MGMCFRCRKAHLARNDRDALDGQEEVAGELRDELDAGDGRRWPRAPTLHAGGDGGMEVLASPELDAVAHEVVRRSARGRETRLDVGKNLDRLGPDIAIAHDFTFRVGRS